MANKKIAGITIEIGGDTSKLGKAIEENEKQTRSLQSELKEVERLLKFDPSNTELLAQKQALLTSAIEETSQKLSTLREAEEQVEAQFNAGEIGEEQFRAFQREIIATEGRLQSMQQRLEDTQQTMAQTGAETEETASRFDQLSETIADQEDRLNTLKAEYTNVVLEQGKNSREAKDLAKEMKALNDELQENKDDLNAAESAASKLTPALEDVGDGAEESGGGFTIMKGALADLVSNVIQSAVSAVGGLVGALFELSEATEEYRQMQAKLEGSANSFGYSVDFAKEKYEEFYRYLGDDQMATNAITNLMGLGTSTESLTELANGAIGVWASYGDSIPIESLTEAINETIQVGQVTGTFADTINWAKVSNEEFTASFGGNNEAIKAFNDALKEGESQEDAYSAALAAMSDEQERAEAVARFLNSTYGESKATYDEMTGSLQDANTAELNLKDTQALLGEAVEPVNTAITELKNEALQAILPLVQDLAEAFMDLLTWLRENPAAMQALTAVVTALAVAFGILAAALGIQALIQGVTSAMSALNIVLSLNPIMIVVAAIAGLVAAFLYLWNTSDSFREFWIQLWEIVSTTVTNVWNAIVSFFTVTIPEQFAAFRAWWDNLCLGISTAMSNMWLSIVDFFMVTIPQWIQNVITFFQQIPYYIGYMVGYVIAQFAQWALDLWTFATVTIPNWILTMIGFLSQLPGQIWNAIVSAISLIAQWGQQMIDNAVSKIQKLISDVIRFLQQLPGKIWNAIKDAIQRVIEWGQQMVTKAVEAAQKLVTDVVNKVSELPGKMLEIGRDIVEGIWEGISGAAGWLMDQISGFCSGVLDGIKGFFGIASPSKLMRDEVGRFLAEGVSVGISDNADDPIAATQNLVDDMIGSIDGARIERSIKGRLSLDEMSTNITGSQSTLLSALNEVIALLNNFLPELLTNSQRSLVLDDGTLVGALAPGMDSELGALSVLKKRGG